MRQVQSQIEMPALEAHQRRALAHFRGCAQTQLTEASQTIVKKRQELARAIECLRSPPLSQGMARELRKQQAVLEREIAELEK